jgi:hypothetical protein
VLATWAERELADFDRGESWSIVAGQALVALTMPVLRAGRLGGERAALISDFSALSNRGDRCS